jgi:hypothetical protein
MGDSSQSSYPTIKQPFLIEDYDGSMIDARPLVAALNKNIHKCDSRNRVDKVKMVLQGNNCEGCIGQQHDNDDDIQSYTLGTFGAFCFEDAEVSGGFRFWIGQIDKMLRVANGKKERVFRRVDLTATTQKEMLLCCTWLQPNLPPGSSKDNVLTAREYVYCSTSENKDFISSEYLRYIVRMEDDHHTLYKIINAEDIIMLRTIIAAKAMEGEQLPIEQVKMHTDEVLSVVPAPTPQMTTKKRKKGNNIEDSRTQVDTTNTETRSSGRRATVSTRFANSDVWET